MNASPPLQRPIYAFIAIISLSYVTSHFVPGNQQESLYEPDSQYPPDSSYSTEPQKPPHQQFSHNEHNPFHVNHQPVPHHQTAEFQRAQPEEEYQPTQYPEFPRNHPGFSPHNSHPGFSPHNSHPGFSPHPSHPGFSPHPSHPGFSPHRSHPGFPAHPSHPGFPQHEFPQSHIHQRFPPREFPQSHIHQGFPSHEIPQSHIHQGFPPNHHHIGFQQNHQHPLHPQGPHYLHPQGPHYLHPQGPHYLHPQGPHNLHPHYPDYNPHDPHEQHVSIDHLHTAKEQPHQRHLHQPMLLKFIVLLRNPENFTVLIRSIARMSPEQVQNELNRYTAMEEKLEALPPHNPIRVFIVCMVNLLKNQPFFVNFKSTLPAMSQLLLQEYYAMYPDDFNLGPKPAPAAIPEQTEESRF